MRMMSIKLMMFISHMNNKINNLTWQKKKR